MHVIIKIFRSYENNDLTGSYSRPICDYHCGCFYKGLSFNNSKPCTENYNLLEMFADHSDDRVTCCIDRLKVSLISYWNALWVRVNAEFVSPCGLVKKMCTSGPALRHKSAFEKLISTNVRAYGRERPGHRQPPRLLTRAWEGGGGNLTLPHVFRRYQTN